MIKIIPTYILSDKYAFDSIVYDAKDKFHPVVYIKINIQHKSPILLLIASESDDALLLRLLWLNSIKR